MKKVYCVFGGQKVILNLIVYGKIPEKVNINADIFQIARNTALPLKRTSLLQ
ncbi:MAG TPA: hypothetical protein PKV21_01330 [bacterium]|nr:hypothetical protein [bacterium]HOM26131.1 hypothetical protein [bacterium]